jgi:hypothetical protein
LRSEPHFRSRAAFSLVMLLLGLTATSSCAARNVGRLLVVRQDGKYGFIDTSGRVVIRPQFIWANDFWRDRGEAYVCGHYVSLDASGGVHPPRAYVPNRLHPRVHGQKVGFVDDAGRFAIAPAFDDAQLFSEGLAAVQLGDRWGSIDTSGTLVIAPRFTGAYWFRQGVAFATLDSGRVIIDRSGRVLASGYDFGAGITSEGRVPVTKDGKSGYLDLQGRVVIPLSFEQADSFSNGLAAVRQGGKWGYLDRAGRTVIPLVFDQAGTFGSGLAPVKLGAKTGFINRSGRFAFDLAFDQAPGFLTYDETDRLLVADARVSRFWTADGRFGYVNTAGQVIWGPIAGSPDHPPLLGWSDEEKVESCQGVSETMKAAVTRLFPR